MPWTVLVPDRLAGGEARSLNPPGQETVVEEKAMQGDVMRVAVIGRTGRGDWGHAID